MNVNMNVKEKDGGDGIEDDERNVRMKVINSIYLF